MRMIIRCKTFKCQSDFKIKQSEANFTQNKKYTLVVQQTRRTKITKLQTRTKNLKQKRNDGKLTSKIKLKVHRPLDFLTKVFTQSDKGEENKLTLGQQRQRVIAKQGQMSKIQERDE